MITKDICCTCLSKDRKLMLLCRLPNGLNNFYQILTIDPDAYQEAFYKDAANLNVCWECNATINRITKFMKQACLAQKLLTNLIDDDNDIKIKNLSHLATQIFTNYDYNFIENELCEDLYMEVDNFIDCGSKDTTCVSSDDELPLAQLSKIDSKKNLVEIVSKTDFNTDSPPRKGNLVVIKRISKKDLIENQVLNKSKLNVNDDLNKVSEIKTKSSPSKTYKKPYLCKECGKHFSTKGKKWNHIQKYHREGYRCEVCSKRFSFKNALIKHQIVHQAPLPREECPTCRKLVRIDLLKVHLKTHKDREKIRCDLCNKSFVSRTSYVHHLRYTQAHANNEVILKHKCTVCNKGYRSVGELRDHVNYQHMNATAHACPECGKGLATRRCVTRHILRAHRGARDERRDHVCQQCGKAFRDRKCLREHELIHVGARPLSCEVCGATFRHRASLHTHRRRVHKIKPVDRKIHILQDDEKLGTNLFNRQQQ